MWDRGILKSNAKVALQGRYWPAFAASLVAFILTGGYSMVTYRYNFDYNQYMNMDYSEIIRHTASARGASYMGIVYMIFVALPISIGIARFFVQNHFGVTQIETVFSGFRRNYLNGIGSMLVTQIFIFLWSLLLVIPGIIKSLQYSQVAFILADNPSMPGSRAREISRIMTNGEKGAIFVLYLSFIGWYFLGGICLGIGILFVNPYFQATQAELYLFLRDRAIQTNQVHPAEFGLIGAAPYVDSEVPPIL